MILNELIEKLNRKVIEECLREDGFIEEWMSSQLINDEIEYFIEGLLEDIENGLYTYEEVLEIYG